MLLVLVTEVSQGGQYRVGGRLSQSAERPRLYLPRQPFQAVDILHCSFAHSKFGQNFQHLFGAQPAERALAAGLPLREFQEVAGNLHHAVVLVEHDHAAGAHHGAGLLQGVEIYR
ncbi:hypothetical protein ES703_86434 [subsurface metagenome]